MSQAPRPTAGSAGSTGQRGCPMPWPLEWAHVATLGTERSTTLLPSPPHHPSAVTRTRTALRTCSVPGGSKHAPSPGTLAQADAHAAPASPVLLTRNLSLREAEQQAWGHTAKMLQGWDLNPNLHGARARSTPPGSCPPAPALGMRSPGQQGWALRATTSALRKTGLQRSLAAAHGSRAEAGKRACVPKPRALCATHGDPGQGPGASSHKGTHRLSPRVSPSKRT